MPRMFIIWVFGFSSLYFVLLFGTVIKAPGQDTNTQSTKYKELIKSTRVFDRFMPGFPWQPTKLFRFQMQRVFEQAHADAKRNGDGKIEYSHEDARHEVAHYLTERAPLLPCCLK